MKPHPQSPRAYCDRLGLKIDLGHEGSPAIIGPTGKRHYWPHGRDLSNPFEMMPILKRYARMKGI